MQLSLLDTVGICIVPYIRIDDMLRFGLVSRTAVQLIDKYCLELLDDEYVRITYPLLSTYFRPSSTTIKSFRYYVAMCKEYYISSTDVSMLTRICYPGVVDDIGEFIPYCYLHIYLSKYKGKYLVRLKTILSKLCIANHIREYISKGYDVRITLANVIEETNNIANGVLQRTIRYNICNNECEKFLNAYLRNTASFTYQGFKFK